MKPGVGKRFAIFLLCALAAWVIGAMFVPRDDGNVYERIARQALEICDVHGELPIGGTQWDCVMRHTGASN